MCSFAGAGCAGTETLKNLVLPGVGAFTIIDGESVTEADCASIFFVRRGDVGHPRAAVAAELLMELNPDVRGSHRVAKVADLLETEPDLVRPYTLVVAAGLEPLTVQRVAELCWASSTPLVVCRALGLLGSVRLQLRHHEIVESKPEAQYWDLRLAEPFAELRDLLAGYEGMAEMSDVDHAHVPFLVILAKLTAEWKAAHDGQVPRTREEKDEFRALVAAAERKIPGKPRDMNFEEAENHAFRAWADPRDLPWEAQAALDKALGADAGANGEFMRMLRAAALFMREENAGLPPLPGTIPDMHADTARYVALQRAYAARAAAEAGQVARRYAAALGRALTEAEDAKVRALCKHLRDVKLLSTTSLMEETERPQLGDFASALLEADDDFQKRQTPALWYLALRAADRFFLKRLRWPGTGAANSLGGLSQGTAAEDADMVMREMATLITESGVDPACFEPVFSRAYATEIVRFGGAELHPVAALVGGVASQEAVKIITRQYTPIDHTYLFNGVACVAATLNP